MPAGEHAAFGFVFVNLKIRFAPQIWPDGSCKICIGNALDFNAAGKLGAAKVFKS